MQIHNVKGNNLDLLVGVSQAMINFVFDKYPKNR